jgi:hypothetical protein
VNKIRDTFANDAKAKPPASQLVMRRYSENLVVVVVACFLFSAGVLAQNTALSLWQGVLRDAAGVPIHGAGVHLKGKSGAFNATTGTDGQFRFELIPAGQYQLSVDANHDKIQYASPINIGGPSPTVVITLLAQKSLSVTSATDQRPATGGEELSSQTVSVLPLNKRDFSQLLLLAAGTMTDANGATNFTQQFAINGQRGVEAVFAMDGADISDPEMGGSTFSNFNVDAVEEIRSSSGWMPAEIGRGAAGFTNIVTRSGSSGFHGSVFEFVSPFAATSLGLQMGAPFLFPMCTTAGERRFTSDSIKAFVRCLEPPRSFLSPRQRNARE